MRDARTEDRIREIDRRVAELDALLGKQHDAATSNNGGSDPRIKSQDDMIYWANRRQERNTLLPERYRPGGEICMEG